MSSLNLSFLPASKFSRAVAGLATGTLVSQAILLLISPVLTRLYSPGDFGAFSLYVALIAILGIIAGLRYEMALPVVKQDEDVQVLVTVGSIIVLVFSCFCAMLVLFAWDWLETFVQLDGLRPYRMILPLGMASVGLFNIVTFWATREKLYSTQAYAKIYQGVAMAGVQLCSGIMSIGGIGLMAGDFAGRVIAVVHVGQRLIVSTVTSFKTLSMGQAVKVLHRYRHFPMYSAPASFFNTLGLRLPLLLIAAYYGVAEAGWLMLSQLAIGAPVTLIGQSTSRVYTGEMGELQRNNPTKTRGLFLRTSMKLALYCTLPVILFCYFAPDIFQWVFGEAWEKAGFYTRILALVLLSQLIVTPVSTTLTLLEKQGIQLGWDITRAIVIFFGFWFAHHRGWSDLDALTIYSISMLLLYSALWFISLRQIELVTANNADRDL